jgi:hypothetical protein
MDAPLLLSILRSYPKFRSVVACAVAGLPVPDAVLLTHWSPAVEDAVAALMRRTAATQVLIRSEQHGGGLGAPSQQNVALDVVSAMVFELAKTPDLVLAIQAAGVIWRNLHNLNLMVDPVQPAQLLLEVAGPGFNARDLNRYGIVHEQIVLPSYAMEINPALVRQSYVVADSLYTTQREAKLAEYRHARLLHDDATIYQATRYQSLPLTYIRTIWNDLPAIRTALEWLNLEDIGAVISMSFLQGSRGSVERWYWDIHPLSRRV